MSEYETDSQSTSNPSAEKWRIVGDLYDEPAEERPRSTLGERHLSFLPNAAHQLEEIGRRGGLTERQKWHLRQDTLNQLGTADYGSAAVVYENDADRGPIASHYISLEDDTFGQPITDPEVHGLPIITGLARGDQVPAVHNEASAQTSEPQVLRIESPEQRELLPAGEEELLLPSGDEVQPAIDIEDIDVPEEAEQANEQTPAPVEAKQDAPLLTREQRYRRKVNLEKLRGATDAVLAGETTNQYYEFEAAVNGALLVKPSDFTISTIEEAVRTWGNAVNTERQALDSLREALSGYNEFDLDGKVTPSGYTYVRNIEAELDEIDDRRRRIQTGDMEDARVYHEFNSSMIRQRMSSMLDSLEHIRGYRSQINYLIEGEEAYDPPVGDDEESAEDSVLAELEANHAGEVDEAAPSRQAAPEEEDFSQGSFMDKSGRGKHRLPERGTSLIERQRRREIIEE